MYKKVKKILLPFLGMCMLMTMGNCRQNSKELSKPVITVSILPQKYFLEKIAGDLFTIRVMIPPGASPATYDPSPKQVMDLARSAIYFEIGHLVFEETGINNRKRDFENVIFVNTSKGLNLLKSGDEGGDHHHNIDPHVWMSPKNVRSMAETMTNTLVDKFPEEGDLFKTNLNLFNQELDSMDQWIRHVFSGIQNRSFIIYHPALTYYAKDYGLDQIPMEWEGKEPSPSYLKELVKTAATSNIRAILIQQQFNTSEAETLAAETGSEIIPIDPLSYNWEKEIKHITTELARALK